MSLPGKGTLLQILQGRSFHKEASSVQHRVSTPDYLNRGEILLVLESHFAPGGEGMHTPFHYTRLLAMTSKGIGWVWTLTATAAATWKEFR